MRTEVPLRILEGPYSVRMEAGKAYEDRISSGLVESGKAERWGAAFLAGAIEGDAITSFGLRNASRMTCEGCIENSA